jgi:cytochrome c
MQFRLQQEASDQIARGRKVYALYCAGCHGQEGEGFEAPALVGPARDYCDFGDAQRLYAWIADRMPPEDVLPPQETWDVLAFILHANGELPEGIPLKPGTARRVDLRPFCR